MSDIQNIVGTGDCTRCNSLATDLEQLRADYLVLETSLKQSHRLREDEHTKHLIAVGRMQDTIDQLRAEKNDALCRCDGWDTSVTGNQQ